jgi:hypothetical protein
VSLCLSWIESTARRASEHQALVVLTRVIDGTILPYSYLRQKCEEASLKAQGPPRKKGAAVAREKPFAFGFWIVKQKELLIITNIPIAYYTSLRS